MKRHYYLLAAKVWNINHYDEFSMTIDSSFNYVYKAIMDDCKNAVAKKINCHPDKVVVSSVSYLGHMTTEEFNG